MGIISWIILGAIAGWLANLISGTKEKKGCFFNIILGVVGAVVGGLVVNLLGGHGVTGLNIWSIIVATLGALIVIFLVKNIRS